MKVVPMLCHQWSRLLLLTTLFALDLLHFVNLFLGGTLTIQLRNQQYCCIKLTGYCGCFMASLECPIIIMLWRHPLLNTAIFYFSFLYLMPISIHVSKDTQLTNYDVTGWLWSWNWVLSSLAAIATVFTSFTFYTTSGNCYWCLERKHQNRVWYVFFYLICGI